MLHIVTPGALNGGVGFWGFGKGDGNAIRNGLGFGGGKGGVKRGQKRGQKDHGGASKQCIFR